MPSLPLDLGIVPHPFFEIGYLHQQYETLSEQDLHRVEVNLEYLTSLRNLLQEYGISSDAKDEADDVNPADLSPLADPHKKLIADLSSYISFLRNLIDKLRVFVDPKTGLISEEGKYTVLCTPCSAEDFLMVYSSGAYWRQHEEKSLSTDSGEPDLPKKKEQNGGFFLD